MLVRRNGVRGKSQIQNRKSQAVGNGLSGSGRLAGMGDLGGASGDTSSLHGLLGGLERKRKRKRERKRERERERKRKKKKKRKRKRERGQRARLSHLSIGCTAPKAGETPALPGDHLLIRATLPLPYRRTSVERQLWWMGGRVGPAVAVGFAVACLAGFRGAVRPWGSPSRWFCLRSRRGREATGGAVPAGCGPKVATYFGVAGGENGCRPAANPGAIEGRRDCPKTESVL